MKLSSVITKLSEVPDSWIFINYLHKIGRRISEPLDGRSIRISSIFKSHESTPSMYLLYSEEKKRYIYYDHSTGQKGDSMDLVKLVLGTTSYAVAAEDVIKEYQAFLRAGNTYIESQNESNLILKPIYSADYEVREWNIKDSEFFGAYSIPLPLVEEYNIVPFENYSLFKKQGDQFSKVLTVSNQLIYGFFVESPSDDVMKIYQPHNEHAKYITLASDFYFGFEQMDYQGTTNIDTCLILSGAKDALATKAMNINIDVVCPTSENSIMSEANIKILKGRYRYVFTLFDNDTAGKLAMLKYKQMHDIGYLYLKSCEHVDIARNVEMLGQLRVKEELISTINRGIEKYYLNAHTEV